MIYCQLPDGWARRADHRRILPHCQQTIVVGVGVEGGQVESVIDELLPQRGLAHDVACQVTADLFVGLGRHLKLVTHRQTANIVAVHQIARFASRFVVLA
jgi:hypothetical protein